jgi:hypothetical protein
VLATKSKSIDYLLTLAEKLSQKHSWYGMIPSYSQIWCMSHQAASLSCCCLMPSLNFTPVITSASKLYPRNLCQRFW